MRDGATYSSIMYRLSELLTKPLYLTMLGWFRFLSKSISISMFFRSAAPRFSRRTCLMATVSPVPQFSARYTLPKAPLPRQSPSWKSLRPATSWAARCAAPSLLGRCSRSRDWPLWLEELDDFFAWPDALEDEDACEERELEAEWEALPACDTMFAISSGPRPAAVCSRTYCRDVVVDGAMVDWRCGEGRRRMLRSVRCACPSIQEASQTTSMLSVLLLPMGLGAMAVGGVRRTPWSVLCGI
jgi:hypothetical protein